MFYMISIHIFDWCLDVKVLDLNNPIYSWNKIEGREFGPQESYLNGLSLACMIYALIGTALMIVAFVLDFKQRNGILTTRGSA